MKINVRFEGGESRHGNEGVDYMLAELPDGDELYEEVNPEDYLTDEEREEWEAEQKENPDNPHWEEKFGVKTNERTYAALKAMILEQAEEKGVPADALEFWQD